MVPEGGVWNYNFNGINFNQNMRYKLVLDNPKDFYNEMHRTSHFLDFTHQDDHTMNETADKEDFYM